MSNEIGTNYSQEFNSAFQHLAQQKASRLRDCVRVEMIKGEVGYFDQIGAVEMVERTTRHADTPFTQVPHTRRRVSMRDFEASEIVDSQDKARMLGDPTNEYVRAFAAAAGRMQDRLILEAFFGTAYTGKAGATSTSFLAANQIAVDFVESGSAVSSNLTIGKLRKAKELLDAAEAGVDPDEPAFICCTSREISFLLRSTEIASADFNTVRALVNGEVDTFMGFKFKRTELTPLNGSNYRRVAAWRKSGMLLAQLEGSETNIAKDPTKGFNLRVHTKTSFGATRMEEAKCVEIICNPAP